MARIRWLVVIVIAAALGQPGPGAAQSTCAAQPVSYPSDGLRITGVLMRPPGDGRFPAVIYAHSSKRPHVQRPTLEAGTPCFPFVTERGWIYFVPDRRGYGRSEGQTMASALGDRAGLLLLLAVRSRYQQEADDLLAGVEYLRRLPYVDSTRIGIAGYSLGGQITFLAAAAKPDAFRAVIIQGTGSGQYNRLLLAEMANVAQTITAPVLIQHAQDDEDVPLRFSQDLANALKRMGKDVTLRVYEGKHELFASEPRGPAGEWGKDLLDFFARQFAAGR